MARNVFLTIALLALGCSEDGVITDLRTSLPEGDRAAGRDLTRLEIEVWPPEAEACRDLIGWRRSVCGGACTDPPSPRDSGQEPEAVISLERNEDGSYTASDLPVSGSGPWEIVVRGYDASGNAFLYGCKIVASGEGADVALFRPWCDTAACAGQFHPACPVEIDCLADPGDDPDGIGPPTCRPLIPVVFSWEEDGATCDPGTDPRFAPCRQARVICQQGQLEPQFDGQCPDTSAPDCGGTVEGDLDCDGRFPGPCGSCMAGTMMACGSGACAAVATCQSDGTWGDCLIPAGVAESCGGGDEDCDGIPDDADQDAFAACNAGRMAGAPAADLCDQTQGCLCGGRPACTGSSACCGGTCIDVATSTDHCGRCGRACPAGVDCIGGQCDVEMCTVEGCNQERPAGSPGADSCNPSGQCRCGDGPACSLDRSCCGGMCLPGSCEGQDACVPRTETCGNGDEDCDMVPDEADPDALAFCNDGRAPNRPAATACGETGCRCGDGPACAGPEACCESGVGGLQCVDTEANDEFCGNCDTSCEPPQTCVSGVCTG